MYSRDYSRVNHAALAALVGVALLASTLSADGLRSASLVCDPSLTALFSPRHPQVGSYEICTSTDRVENLAPASWRVEPVAPLEAFSSGMFNRAQLSALYGGRRVSVARGWEAASEESVTLISPYPDATLTHLVPGTLVMRFRVAQPVK